MKRSLLIGMMLSLTSTAHAFNLDSVKSIECVDADQVETMKMFFTTTHSGAEKYKRRPGTIPFSYGNLLAYTTKTGLMKVKNSGGSFVWLFEDDGADMSSLKLFPTFDDRVYNGKLSGGAESTGGEWIEFPDHFMTCTLEFFEN